MRLRLCVLLLLFLWLVFPMPASSAPWVSVGDARTRHHIESLTALGCLRAQTLSWPLSWASVVQGYRHVSRLPEQQRSRCQPHMQAVQQAMRQDAANKQGVELTVAAVNQEWLHRDFSAPESADSQAAVALYGQGRRWAGRLSVAYADAERDGEYVRYDHSYFAGLAGNWQLGVGALSRWWGPGWHSSLALSNNARPVPAVWLTRQQHHAPQSPWLRWLGPWDLRLFVGQLEEERTVPDARLLGARFTFRPHPRLQLGLSRLAQWGGEGRPQGWDALWNTLIGRDNGETSGFADGEDPSNQLAGLDFRWSVPALQQPVSVYGQFMGEDEAGGLPSKLSSLAGLDIVTELGQGSQRWFIEATDTVAGSWLSERRYNVMYEHGTYKSGFRYYGRNMASTWEGDAQVVTLGFQHFAQRDMSIGINLSHARLNEEGIIRATTPDSGAEIVQSINEQSVMRASLRIRHTLFGGKLDWLLSGTDKRIITPFEARERWTAGLQWQRQVR